MRELFRSIDEMDDDRDRSLKRRVLRIAGILALTILAFGVLYLGMVVSE
jgi:hypothetical protein